MPDDIGTNPISPKVTATIAALASPGLVLVILGAVLGNDTLVTVGASLLGAAPLVGGAAYVKDDPTRMVARKGKARTRRGGE